MSSVGTGLGSVAAFRSAAGGGSVTPLTQPLASESMARTGRSRVRDSMDSIMSLLFVLCLDNRIVRAFGRSLVGCGLGALFELLVVLRDDAVIVNRLGAEERSDREDCE